MEFMHCGKSQPLCSSLSVLSDNDFIAAMSYSLVHQRNSYKPIFL